MAWSEKLIVLNFVTQNLGIDSNINNRIWGKREILDLYCKDPQKKKIKKLTEISVSRLDGLTYMYVDETTKLSAKCIYVLTRTVRSPLVPIVWAVCNSITQPFNLYTVIRWILVAMEPSWWAVGGLCCSGTYCCCTISCKNRKVGKSKKLSIWFVFLKHWLPWASH